jgi:hypothetical protein
MKSFFVVQERVRVPEGLEKRVKIPWHECGVGIAGSLTVKEGMKCVCRAGWWRAPNIGSDHAKRDSARVCISVRRWPRRRGGATLWPASGATKHAV